MALASPWHKSVFSYHVSKAILDFYVSIKMAATAMIGDKTSFFRTFLLTCCFCLFWGQHGWCPNLDLVFRSDPLSGSRHDVRCINKANTACVGRR